jgi:tRNA G18 (ribose-2'-O)-methylase SpoU
MPEKINKLSFAQITAARLSVEEAVRAVRFPVCAVMENIRSLYNVGAAFRTSDGALIEKLYLCGYTGAPPRREIEKTSLGSVQSVPWEHRPDTCALLRELKGRGYHILALEHTDKSVSYTEARYSFPLCIVVGNEVEGVSDEALALCDSAVEIPMYGIKQSLNASVAYGIIAYHLVNEYRKANP